MDMYTSVTPPTVGFVGGTSWTGISSGSFLSSSAYKRPQTSEYDPSLSRPFISTTYLDKDEVPPPTLLPRKGSAASSQKSSFYELPPTQQCSFAQSVLNGKQDLVSLTMLLVYRCLSYKSLALSLANSTTGNSSSSSSLCGAYNPQRESEIWSKGINHYPFNRVNS